MKPSALALALLSSVAFACTAKDETHDETTDAKDDSAEEDSGAGSSDDDTPAEEGGTGDGGVPSDVIETDGSAPMADSSTTGADATADAGAIRPDAGAIADGGSDGGMASAWLEIEADENHIFEKLTNEFLPLPQAVQLPPFEHIVQSPTGDHYLLTKAANEGQRVEVFDPSWDHLWTSDVITTSSGQPASMGALAVSADGTVYAGGEGGTGPGDEVLTLLARIDEDDVSVTEHMGMYGPQCGEGDAPNIALGALPDGRIRVHHHVNLMDVDKEGWMEFRGLAACGARDQHSLTVDADGNTYYASPTIESELDLIKLGADGAHLGLPGSIVVEEESEPYSLVYLDFTAGVAWDEPSDDLFVFGSSTLYRLSSDGTLVWGRTAHRTLVVEGHPELGVYAIGAFGNPGSPTTLGLSGDTLWVAGTSDVTFYNDIEGTSEGAAGLFIAAYDKDGTARWLRMYDTQGTTDAEIYPQALVPNTAGGFDVVWNNGGAGWVLALDENGRSNAPPADPAIVEVDLCGEFLAPLETMADVNATIPISVSGSIVDKVEGLRVCPFFRDLSDVLEPIDMGDYIDDPQLSLGLIRDPVTGGRILFAYVEAISYCDGFGCPVVLYGELDGEFVRLDPVRAQGYGYPDGALALAVYDDPSEPPRWYQVQFDDAGNVTGLELGDLAE